jgi:hypothetical protein
MNQGCKDAIQIMRDTRGGGRGFYKVSHEVFYYFKVLI